MISKVINYYNLNRMTIILTLYMKNSKTYLWDNNKIMIKITYIFSKKIK